VQPWSERLVAVARFLAEADVVPCHGEEHVRRLTESIRLRGQTTPVTLWLTDGEVGLGDGAHRITACRRLGTEIWWMFQDWWSWWQTCGC